MTDLRKAAEPVEYTGNGTAGREADVRPAGFFFQMSKREWVGLTEDEFESILEQHNEAFPFVVYQSIESKLKEKNT
jgi:hypothetical protein